MPIRRNLFSSPVMPSTPADARYMRVWYNDRAGEFRYRWSDDRSILASRFISRNASWVTVSAIRKIAGSHKISIQGSGGVFLDPIDLDPVHLGEAVRASRITPNDISSGMNTI